MATTRNALQRPVARKVTTSLLQSPGAALRDAACDYAHNLLMGSHLARRPAIVARKLDGDEGLDLLIAARPGWDDDSIEVNAARLDDYFDSHHAMRKPRKAREPVATNLAQLATTLGLTRAERAVLQFAPARSTVDGLDDWAGLFGDLSTGQLAEIVALACGETREAVTAAT